MRFVKESVIKASQERVFAFHRRADAIDLLIPPEENAVVIQKADISVISSRAIIETKLLGLFTVRWIAEHTAYDPPRMFEDIQISGPFKSWRHRHIVEPHPEGSILRDEIEYEAPLWPIGKLIGPLAIEPKLKSMFDYRHRVTAKWCEDESA